jgi:hypothetical protein
MTTVKRAVTLDEDVERQARELAGPSFSAFVNEALKRQVRAARLTRLVEEDVAKRGAVDSAELEAVEAELADLDRP